MSNIKTESENFKNAVKWITEEIKEGKSKDRKEIIMKACFKFNLSPKEEMLIQSKFC